LAALLWPDRTDAQALGNLRQLLHEHAWLSRGDDPVLIVDRRRLTLGTDRLQWESVHADAWALDSDAFLARISGLGRPYLGGLDNLSDEFERWRLGEQTRAHERLARATHGLAEQTLAGGAPQTARRLADLWQGFDPCDEAMARIGMRADAALGDAASMRRRMTALEGALSAELEVRPSATTRKAFDDAWASAPDATIVSSIGSVPTEPATKSALPPVTVVRARPSWSFALGVLVAAALTAVVGGWWIAGSHSTEASAAQRRRAVELTAAARGLVATRTVAGYNRAATLAREAVSQDPSAAPALVELAIALWLPAWFADQDEPGALTRIRAESISYLDRALRLRPGLPRALAAKGLILEGEEGRNLLEGAYRADPADADICLWTANARDAAGDYRGALEAHAKSMDAAPQSARMVGAYAHFARRIGRQDLADAAIARFAPTADKVVVQNMMANAAVEKGDLATAARLELAALKDGPADPFVSLALLAHVARAIGDLHAVEAITAGKPEMLRGYAPIYAPQDVTHRAAMRPKDVLTGIFASEEARSLVSQGQERLLLELAHSHGKSPEDAYRGCCNRAVGLGVQLVVAYRHMGRSGEAASLQRRLSSYVALGSRRGYADIGGLTDRLLVACLEQDGAGAAMWLDQAIERGFRGQRDGIAVDPGDEPACGSVAQVPAFKRARARLAALIAAGRPAAARELAMAIDWIRKNPSAKRGADAS
jgi:DNA-binding SARP family transcriptional activator